VSLTEKFGKQEDTPIVKSEILAINKTELISYRKVLYFYDMGTDAKYQEHKVFEQLWVYSDFYESLSSSIFGFISMGISSVINIDSYMYSSIQGTLDSIRDILLKARINDSYALLRKYYDSVIINTYSILYLVDNY
jgi:hypothetical protein